MIDIPQYVNECIPQHAETGARQMALGMQEQLLCELAEMASERVLPHATATDAALVAFAAIARLDQLGESGAAALDALLDDIASEQGLLGGPLLARLRAR